MALNPSSLARCVSASPCARLARLREEEAALRDVEHLGGCNGAPTSGGRLHRLWRLFAMRQGQIDARLDAAFKRTAADCLERPPHIDCEALTALLGEASTRENPLNAAARVSVASLQSLGDAAQIDAEIFALWLADVALAQKLGWDAPVPLLATVIAHPVLRRGPHGRRPRRPIATGRSRWRALRACGGRGDAQRQSDGVDGGAAA
ncbi:DUF1403 family protein [Methylocystis silviterrae]|uniref:DUF1403 family protein n=1 Tax=Methylocystis silviterrae TaxID=2743612 RepID=UPI003C76FA44